MGQPDVDARGRSQVMELVRGETLKQRIARALLIGAAVAVAALVIALVVRWMASPPGELALGIAALEAEDFAAAEQHLQAAPDEARVHFYLGVLYWWTGRPTPQVHGELDRALAGGLDEQFAAIARGVRALVGLEYPSVIATFQQLAARYPDDRNALYGAFEALFHGGRPTEAMELYRKLRAVAPSFGLARHHALTYYASRGDLEGARAALAGATGTELARWEARIALAAGDRATARARVRDVSELAWDEVALAALAGDLAGAHRLAVELGGKNLPAAAIPLLGLALARGIATGPDGAPHLWNVAMDVARVPPNLRSSTREAWLDLAAMIAAAGDRERARTALAALPRDAEATMIEVGVARALLQATIGDEKALTKLVANPFPEVHWVAVAALDELARKPGDTAAAWQRAAAADGFARAHLAIAVRLARARAAAGDAAGAARACEAVVAPRLFHWSWGAAIGTCTKLSAGRTPR